MAVGAEQVNKNDAGVEFMKRISNTQALRTYPEREEHDRINAHLDRALELTFPCSDPVAITINGIYDVVRRKAAIDSGGKFELVVSFKGTERASLTKPTRFRRTL